jgi:four helix bundle protein
MSSAIRNFRDLDAWKVAMEMVVLAYDVSSGLPSSERFGLIAQIRRAAVSVPSNVAEGQYFGRGKRYIYHVRVALGSVGELATHFELARRLKLLPEEDVLKMEKDLARTGQLLHGLLRSLRRERAKNLTGLALLGAFSLTTALLSVLR